MAGLAASQGNPLELAYCNSRVDDPIDHRRLEVSQPRGHGRRPGQNARCIDGLGAMGFGFVEVGTVTPLAQPGNPKPRMFRLPEANALINRLGFNNHGLDAFIANVQRSALRQSKNPSLLLGLNIGKNAATPDREGHRRLPDLPGRCLPACGLHHRQHLQPQHQEPA